MLRLLRRRKKEFDNVNPADVLYCVVCSDESADRGAGAEFLSAFEYDMSSWKDEESGSIRHTIYFQDRASAETALAFLRTESENWKEFGVVLSGFALSELKKENWAESWKIHFKPIRVSPRLLIRPTWEPVVPEAGRIDIVLDPGMSFGTGQHATTKFCLASLDRITKDMAPDRPLNMLDAGSGSGILAIAAHLLGCRPVRAFDIDPDTVPVARENLEKNGLPADSVSFAVSALEEWPSGEQYDIVAANILSSALIAGREKLLSLTRPGGWLILAGILDREYGTVRSAFEELGCREMASEAEKEWRGGAFLTPRA